MVRGLREDLLADGRRFRVFAVTDDFSRECLARVVDTSISGKRVKREVATIAELPDKPCTIVSDSGTEPTSNAILARTEKTGIEWHCIAPGKPMRDTPLSRASTAAS